MTFSIQDLFNNKYVMIAIIVLIFVVSAYFLYRNYANQNSETITDDIYEGMDNNDGSEAELMLFHVDWCPHCKTALPEWEKLKQEYANKKVNGHKIIFLEYNCTEESEETTKKMETYKIEGFPTIKLKVEGRVIEFDAKVTKANLEQFLATALA
uniref:Thioredoxin domain-containing protein n=1 Tax=viral metagenome TaxID=1070528 RepID=A0A6C0EHS0_9ZZZZ